MMKKLLITGGAGFIGSHLVKLFCKTSDYLVINLDALTYSGNLNNLTQLQQKANHVFVKGNICDEKLLTQLFKEYDFDSVIHLAAESHVDRSIKDPMRFIKTNIEGTVNLLNVARDCWSSCSFKDKVFYQISTDEVYGTLGLEGSFTEKTPYAPRSPYAASKASSDHFIRSYTETYNIPTIISNCSNNYGPNQFPEKLIPLCINNIFKKKKLPIYGKGENIRDWLYVEDHVVAIKQILERGKTGESYNIGGMNEWKNIDLVKLICNIMDRRLDNEPFTSQKLITFVEDRKGHDFRYAIHAGKLIDELGWKPKVTFEQGIEKTIIWYLENRKWLEDILSRRDLKS